MLSNTLITILKNIKYSQTTVKVHSTLNEFDHTQQMRHTMILSLTSTLGYGLLALAIITLAFSNQRRLLGFMLAGMVYWLLIEGIHSGLTALLPLTTSLAYAVAIIVSFLPFIGWAVYREATATTRLKKAQAKANAKYIEHTPIYKNYQPKF